MVAGDTCNIEAGTYPQPLTPVTLAQFGTSSAPITFQAYPSTAIVTISGTTSITGWTLESANIYYAPMSWNLGFSNQVFMNGAMMPEARWPNAGSAYPWQNSSVNPSPDWSYMQTTGYTGSGVNGWFTDSHLPSRPPNYWVGAIVHAMSGDGWVMQAPTVTSSSGTTLTTNDANGSGTAYAFTGASGTFNGNEYYLSGIKGEMDSPGEWYYDSPDHRLYIYSSTGVPTGVQAKQNPYGFDLTGRSYIQMINLRFFACTIKTDATSTNELFNGLSMLYLDHSSTYSPSYGLTLHDGDVLRNSELAFDSQGLVTLDGNNIRVINNNLHDSGYIPIWTAMMQCVDSNAYGALISHNTLYNSGRGAMGFPGLAAIVEYNNMHNAMQLTSDGAIYYSILDAGNSIIRYNLIHDSPGPVGHLGGPVQGLYLDAQNSNWIIHHNIISNVPGFSMQINARNNSNMIFNNTCANSAMGSLVTSFQSDGDTGTEIYNNLFGAPPVGTCATWDESDLQDNLYVNPGFASGTFPENCKLQSTSSLAIDQGMVITGITDGYVGAAPDLGALEYGGTDWTSSVGYNTVPPSPDPIYTFPSMAFANQVRDGSFETGSLAPNWTTSGSATLYSNPSGETSWNDPTLRSGAYGLKFGAGTSEVSETVTGLQPNQRYRLYGGTQTANATAAVNLGVRNYGYPATQVSTPATGNWVMNNLTFVTGPSTTSAQIYLDVASTTTTPVYADDFSVEPYQSLATVDPIVQYAFNQSSGTTVNDSSIYGQNGTVSGVANWQAGLTGIYNYSLDFNGTNNYVLTPAITTPTELTVSCWAKSNTTSSPGVWDSWGCFFCQRPSFFLTPVLGTNQIRLTVYTSPTVSSTTVYVPPAGFDIKQWHHYAGVISSISKSAVIYVDGVPVSSVTFGSAINPTSIPVTIGFDTGTSGGHFNGEINDARIYNRALTESQIKTVAGIGNGLMLHYAFDESSGAVAWDSSGLGLNGALVNAPTWGSGIFNNALTFNGASNYVVTPTVSTPTELTVSCWAKSNTTSSPAVWDSYGCFFCQRPSFFLTPVPGTTYMRLTVYTSPTVAVGPVYALPSGFNIKQWHQYAAVISSAGKTIILYIDGVRAISVALDSPINISTAPVSIGVDTGAAGRYFNGQIDDAYIYSRALSADEILRLYLH